MMRADLFRNERARLIDDVANPTCPQEDAMLREGQIGEVVRESRHPVFGRCYVVKFQATPFIIFGYVPVGLVESAEV